MRILAIDYGKKKVGVAYADTPLAEPLSVIRYQSYGDLLAQIKNITEDKDIDKIVVGISEGLMAEESEQFGIKLGEDCGIPVEFVSEIFTTKDAQNMALSGGVKRAKRKQMEDAYAAAVILQKYLDYLG